MSDLLCANGLHVFRVGLRTVYARNDFLPTHFRELLKTPGASMKHSRKSRVRRVGRYSVKESRARFGVDWLKHTFQRGRARRPWLAAHHLQRHNVCVPAPVAFAETRLLGLVLGHMMVSEYLEGYQSVEEFLVTLVERGAGMDTVSAFLQDLADAVNRLCACGGYHADLSGKNILTRDLTHLGVGIAVNDNGDYWATQVFARF